MESFFQATINSVLEAVGGGNRSTRTPDGSSSGSGSSSSGISSGSSRRNGASAVRSNTTPESPGHTAGPSFRTSASFASRPAPDRAASSSAAPRAPSGRPPQQGGAPPPPSRGGASDSPAERGRNSRSSDDSSQTAKYARCGRTHERGTPSTSTTPNDNNNSSNNSSNSNSSSSNSNSNSSSGSSGDAVRDSGENAKPRREGGSVRSRDPSPVRDREAGERLKELGNESFRRGMYGLAVEYYSKAIAADGSVASYFTNRALCHKREHRYSEALKDAEAALALEESNVKGLYIKGDALVQLGDLDGGVRLLEKAEKASSSGAARAAHEIRHSLLNAKKLRFESNRKQRTAERENLAKFLKDCISVAAKERQLSPEEEEARLSELEILMKEAQEADRPFEPPDFLNCRISMGLMDEPVVTPSGITYEKKLLLEHLNRNGPTDPLTREPCDRNRLIPNYAIKEATAWFLERFPWAYDA